MVFSSIPFLFFFLPLFLAAYFVTPSIQGKNLVTLLCSLLFYGWGEPWFVLVLLASIAFNTIAAVVIDACRGSGRAIALTLAVTANLLLLNPTPDAALFLRFLRSYLERELARPEVTRWIDQLALVMARHHLWRHGAGPGIRSMPTSCPSCSGAKDGAVCWI